MNSRIKTVRKKPGYVFASVGKKSMSVVEVLRKKDGAKSEVSLKIAIIPVMLALYDRIYPDLRGRLDSFAKEFGRGLDTENLKVITTPIVANDAQMRDACGKNIQESVDLIVVAHMSYSPSGQLAPALLDCDIPVLLWPAQPLMEVIAEEYDNKTVEMNHGVHGTLDLANVLCRKGKEFGVLQGHWQDKEFCAKLNLWAQAGRLIKAMKESNPAVLGGRFEGMLDLQLDDEVFIRELGVKPQYIPVGDFTCFIDEVSADSVQRKVGSYRSNFELPQDVSEELLSKTARNELALRKLLNKYNSRAVGINFVNTCNNPDVSDALHVPASILMTEGTGYAGEGDWETAMFMRGLQAALGVDQASFTEIFSVGYKDQRFVLKHWGEGNFALAREKPALAVSKFRDIQEAIFLISDFEYVTGQATLINLNATPKSEGQIISISGVIEEDSLPSCDGVRAIFKPETDDIAQLLTDYCTFGGSHHMVLVRGKCQTLLDKLATLTGWKYCKL